MQNLMTLRLASLSLRVPSLRTRHAVFGSVALLAAIVVTLPSRAAASPLPSVQHAQTHSTSISRQQLTNSLQASASAAAAEQTSDVCLAIDDSGSMWNDTDQGPASDPGPNPLRAQAARVAISLLGADVNNPRDGVGVVLFGSADNPGDDIITLPVTQLASNAAREALYGRIDSSMWSKGFTRIDRALDSCLVILAAGQSADIRARIILLTDGVPVSGDPRFDAEGQLRALDWTLNELADRGWSVDVILLGATGTGIANDPNSFASRIANQTGGRVFVANERTDLLRIYSDHRFDDGPVPHAG
jgi:von Willebrand factor type A domain